MRVAQSGHNVDGEAQEGPRLHRFADQSLERFAAEIIEQERCSTTLAGKRKRPRRPFAVERVPQFIFVGETIEGGWRRALRGKQHSQRCAAAAVAAYAPPAAEDAFAILPQDLEVALPISVELKGMGHLPNSAALPRSDSLRILLNDSAARQHCLV